MRGSVLKRGKTWSYVLYLGRDEKGRKRQKWVGGHRTRKDAEAALLDALTRVQTGVYADPGRQTVGEYLEGWLDAVKPTLAATTWAGYRQALTKWVIPRIGRVRLSALTSAQLARLYGQLLDGGGRDGRPLSPRSVRLAHTVTGRALADAVEWGLLPRNPARSVRPPKEKTREMTVWRTEELKEFLAATRDHRFYPLWVVFLTTGLRRSEAAGLRWDDLDLDRGTLAVRHTRVAVDYRVEDSEPKSIKSRRLVSLDDPTVLALRQHRKRQLEERLAAGPLWQDSGLVFVQEDGQPYHPDTISYFFEKTVKRVGVPPIRLHDLRHTSATLALAAGVHPKIVQERLGHANISITLDTYSHVVPGMQEEAAAKVAKLIFD
ncbi:MAG: site-specific integrase [Actinomycetota bacterium]|nr:site-specific integrase [Actinomycetota bacterium]